MTNDPLNLDEAIEWAGLWWLPDDPDKQVPGVLRYDGQGSPSLSLIGAFEERIFSNPAPGMTVYHEGTRTWDVIHGVAEQREVTLLGCIPTSTKRALGARVKSPDTQTVRAKIAIIGAHISGQEDAAFAAAEVSVEDLGFWAASSVFEGSFGISDGKIDGTGTISVKPVEARTVTVDGTEYCLVHTHTLPFFDQRMGGTVGRMHDTASIRLCPAESFTLGAALEAASLIRDLIALATHRAAGVIWLRLEVAGIESSRPNGQPLARRCADVLYSPVALGKHDTKVVDPHRAFFTCDELPFEEVVPRWCEVHGRLRAATNMILGLRYAPALFIENNLLTAVGAAEVLHRGLGIDEKPFPMEEFAQMREAMLGQVPEEHRARFKAAIRNDPTLRDRLRALAARPDPEAIAQLVPDIDHWAKRTARARNDLAHEGRTANHSIDELSAIVEATTAVVVLNVLHELRLPAERQRHIAREHPQFRAVFQKAREWLVPQAPTS
ncbi:HEPN domain-containing protein [Trueperella pyogenes]|uniref:ApeA N-terminal domain 1-containing protein n=1 Tax=Trueperella pyogenes TaxID=1661 RepID=UPI00345D8935